MESNVADWKSYDTLIPQGQGQTVIIFHPVQKYMEHASKLRGAPVYKEVIHLKKILPADNTYIYDAPVRDSDKEQYAAQWDHYCRTKENKVLGIPIEHWHSISDTQKAEFKAMNIQTVEQFAGLSDILGQKIMGFHELREKAKVFAAAGKDAEMLGRIREESSVKEAALQSQIDKLTALLEERTGPKAK